MQRRAGAGLEGPSGSAAAVAGRWSCGILRSAPAGSLRLCGPGERGVAAAPALAAAGHRRDRPRSAARARGDHARGSLADEPQRASIPSFMTTAIGAATVWGGPEMVARLSQEVVRTPELERRERMLAGLGGAREPSAARELLALTLDERVDARASIALLFGLSRQRETRRTAFDFLKTNYDALVARQPQGEFSTAVYLPLGRSRLVRRGHARRDRRLLRTARSRPDRGTTRARAASWRASTSASRASACSSRRSPPTSSRCGTSSDWRAR